METLHRAFLAGGNRVGHVPMGKQMPGTELPVARCCGFSFLSTAVMLVVL